MQFSNQFKQGETVAVYPNRTTGSIFKVFFIRNTFVVIQFKQDGTINCVPYSVIQTGLNLASNDANYIQLVNGFTVADFQKCADTAKITEVFGVNALSGFVAQFTEITNISGTIEPVDSDLATAKELSLQILLGLQNYVIKSNGLEGELAKLTANL